MEDVQVSIESADGLQRRIRVSVPAGRIEREVEAKLRSVRQTARLPGFRPGKVPERVIRQRYGDQVHREVLEDVLQSSYAEAVNRQKLRPAGGPEIEAEQIELGKDLSYTATFEVYPDIELTGLEGLTVERPEASVTEADVDAMIETLRRQRGHWHPVERPAREGDRVIADFEAAIAGEPVPGGKGEQVQVILGAGRMLPDFERGLAGGSSGEQREFVVQFPDDYHARELAGKAADFVARLHEVAEEHLPEVDPSFVKDFGVASGDLGEFRADVRQSMEQEAAGRADTEVRRRVLEAFLAANPVAVPSVLVEREAQALQSEAMRNLGNNAPDQAPPLENFHAAAERRVRMGLLIGAVIREQELRLDRERVRQRIDQLAEGYDKPDEIRKIYLQTPQLMSQVENVVLEQQAVEWLLSRATVTPKPVTFSELMAS